MDKKKLVIIIGITGAIGTALLEQYGGMKNTIVLGISRKARDMQEFISHRTGKFHTSTFICSLTEINKDYCEKFISLIDFNKFSEINYIHCVGTYPFEIDRSGQFTIANDHDEDGIDDECMMLSYSLFRWITTPLITQTNVHINCAILGGLADRHEPKIIYSRWKTMRLTMRYMKDMANERTGMFVFNISSVLCPHEIITRPYVFVNTEAESQMWLSPYKLAATIHKKLRNNKGGYHESDVFKHWPGFFPDFYSDKHMVPRRLAETERR